MNPEAMKLGKVLIIGNGPQPANLDELIDAADTVIRFNACNGHVSNKRTDILCLATGATPPMDLVGVKVIWLWNRSPVESEWYPDVPRYVTAGEDQLRLEKLESKMRAGKILSSGTLALFRVMYLGAECVTLAGFSWQGWAGHDWPVERDYCEGLANGGMVKIEHQHRRAIFLPFFGEFGHMILQHIRYVHAFSAKEKIVFCEPGQECLFPSATGFRHDWYNFVPEEKRQTVSSWCPRIIEAVRQYDGMLRSRLQKEDAGAALIRAGQHGAQDYDCMWHTSDSVKFSPNVPHSLPDFDVAIQARYRAFGEARNFTGWKEVVSDLKSRGLRIAVLGNPSTTYTECDWDVRAWDHSDGYTAGTVDALKSCKAYIGTDSGVSHLAALMDVPMAVFRRHDGSGDWTGIMQRANRRFFRRLDDSIWEKPRSIADAIELLLSENK